MEAAGKLVCLQKSLETSNLCILEPSQAFISALGCILVLAAVVQGRVVRLGWVVAGFRE